VERLQFRLFLTLWHLADLALPGFNESSETYRKQYSNNASAASIPAAPPHHHTTTHMEQKRKLNKAYRYDERNG
jgi:hypothetical protein